MTGDNRCGRCGTEVIMSIKSWIMKPKKDMVFRVEIYECPRCFHRWRKVMRIR